MIVDWFIGPQLIGFIMLMAGWLMKVFPPKEINSFYGYRTVNSMHSLKTWEFANSYSAVLMIRSGIILIGFGLVVTALMLGLKLPRKTISIAEPVLVIGSVIIASITIIRMTEKRLKEKFGKRD